MNGAIGEHLSVTDWEHCRITVVIPTYNEADNLPAMTEALLRLALPNMQVLIVDDNSPDGTGAVADELAARFNAGLGEEQRPRLLVMHRQGKGGLGTAYVAGMSRAIADGADYIVQMDADFSHSPRYLPQMLGVLLATEADVVIGSRYVPGGSLDAGWEWSRRLLSWWANLYSRAILGLQASRCGGAPRCKPSAWKTCAATATVFKLKWPICAKSWASVWSRFQSILKIAASVRASSTSLSSSNRPGAPGKSAGSTATWPPLAVHRERLPRRRCAPTSGPKPLCIDSAPIAPTGWRC